MLASCKIISSALCQVAPNEIQIKRNSDGAKEHNYKKITLIPPYPRENSWVLWVAKSYYHFWWIVEIAWNTDKELSYRFSTSQSNFYLKLSKLVEEGIARHFPKPDYKKVSNWPATFPIIGGEINSHRQNYKKLPVRMKWTNRETPEFFKDAFSCPKCFAIRPVSVCDDSFCYYSQN